jgi:hypothetical protein
MEHKTKISELLKLIEYNKEIAKAFTPEQKDDISEVGELIEIINSYKLSKDTTLTDLYKLMPTMLRDDVELLVKFAD